MRHAEAATSLAQEQFGSRKNKSVILHALIKHFALITFDLSNKMFH